MTTKQLTDEQLLELAKNPEFRAEIAVKQAKSPVHLIALIAEAIRDAVKQDRAEVDEILEQRTKDCFCADNDPEQGPCQACYETAVIQGTLKARKER